MRVSRPVAGALAEAAGAAARRGALAGAAGAAAAVPATGDVTAGAASAACAAGKAAAARASAAMSCRHRYIMVVSLSQNVADTYTCSTLASNE